MDGRHGSNQMKMTLEGVSVSFDQGGLPLEVLKDVSADFRSSEITAIVGPSGCGKTTLLNVMAGIISPNIGSVRRSPTMGRYAGYVFQEASLFPWLSIRGNALFGAKISGILSASVTARCNELLLTFGLGGFEDRFPSALSGGMQQRVSIIRALLSGAKLLLLDEPFSSSDFCIKLQLQRLLSEMVERDDLIAVVVTHDVYEAAQIADRVYVMTRRPGRINALVEIPLERTKRVALSHGSAAYLQEILRAMPCDGFSGTSDEA